MKNYQCLTCGLCSSSLQNARDHKWISNHGKFVIRSVKDITKDCLKQINVIEIIKKSSRGKNESQVIQ